METKQFIDFELKAEGDEGVIVGYGSIFGNVDKGGDVVIAGAFSKSIASGLKPKMLWQHDSGEVIGVWDVISEDEKGLKVEGRLAKTPRGNEAKELIKMGALSGLSVGYKTIDSEYNSEGNRLLKELELWEVSVVTFAMNESATIDSIKAAEMTKTELEKFLVKAGLSRSVSKGLIAKGYEGFSQSNLRKADISDEDEKKLNTISEKTNNEIRDLLNRRINILK